MNQVALARFKVELQDIRSAIKLEHDRCRHNAVKLPADDVIRGVIDEQLHSYIRLLVTVDVVQERLTKHVLNIEKYVSPESKL